MPQLSKRELKKFYLPSTKGLPKEEQAWVELNVRVQMSDLLNTTDGMTTTHISLTTLVDLINDWNFTNEKDEKEPVNFENVSRIEPEDYVFLTGEIQKAAREKQKGLSAAKKKK